MSFRGELHRADVDKTIGEASPRPPSAIEQASMLHQRGQLDQAEAIYNGILETAPDHLDALHLLGLLRHQQGRNVEALRLIGAALKRAPNFTDAINNMGVVLRALDRHADALTAFETALAVRPDHPNALVNSAETLKRLKRYDRALAAYQRVLAQKPDHLVALNECGGLHARLGNPEAALADYESALAIAPRSVELLINRGTALRALNRDEEALNSFAEAIAIDPQRAEARWNASLVRLRRGDFEAGWKDYEWRWRKPDWADKRRNFDAPLWLGNARLEGKTILLHAEQGFGDTLQFVRYARLVAGLGATVILECQPELKSLLQRVEGVSRVVERGEPLPDFDWHCPLLSLPLAFGTRLHTVPADVPYIAPPVSDIDAWDRKFAGFGKPRIGFVWSGNGAHLNDHNRSVPLPLMIASFTSGAYWVILQKNISSEDAAMLARHPNVMQVGDELRDFADTAAAIAALDLVVTVDTAAAHLAGAMGKPVWILLPFSPDFRWLLDREDSPWYPTVRLFRQQHPGDWQSVVGRVREALALVLN
jgi:tetratricopeptide (TPR) repeat protein